MEVFAPSSTAPAIDSAARRFDAEAMARIASTRPGWFAAIGLPFLLTRVALTIVGVLAAEKIGTIDSPEIPRLSRVFVLDLWSHFDGSWYLDIAANGYRPAGAAPSNTVFSPLLPMCISAGRMAGGGAFADDAGIVAGLLVSNAALLLALTFLRRLIALDFDDATARRAILYVLAFPTTLFLSAVYPMSLMLAIGVIAFYLARRRQWASAGAVAALAPLARPDGVMIVIPLFVEWWIVSGWGEKCRRDATATWTRLAAAPNTTTGDGDLAPTVPSTAAPDCVALAVSTDGVAPAALPADLRGGVILVSAPAATLAGWLAFLAIKLGDPLIFMRSQSYWASMSWQNAFSHADFGAVLVASLAVGCFALLAISWRHLRPSYTVYFAIFLSIMISCGRLWSFPRFVLVLFPAFIALAIVGRKPWIHRMIVAGGGAAAAVLMIKFAAWSFVG
jgi:hypothetical protein